MQPGEKTTENGLVTPPKFSDLAVFDPPGASAAVATVPAGEVRMVGGIEVQPGTPLAYLLGLMDQQPGEDFSPEQRLYLERMRLEAAKAALPAIHPRLSQVDHRGGLTLTHEQALDELEKSGDRA